MSATEQLALYRSRHVIRAENFGTSWQPDHHCQTCGVRVHERHGARLRNGWLHDPDEIKRLVKAAVLTGWTEAEKREAFGG